MPKIRLDQAMVERGLVPTRSQAESYIKLGTVEVNDRLVTKPGYFVDLSAKVILKAEELYVSRAALKLASVAKKLDLDFTAKIILDVGSSTGGFTDYALKHGATKSIAVDVGTNQLHPSLRTDPRIELHEQTDIRSMEQLSDVPDITVIDVSFISLRLILPQVKRLSGPRTQIVAMCKPQFEAGEHLKNKGVIKNDHMRRDLLRDFEIWLQTVGGFIIQNKADSGVAGSKGNQERFYLLQAR